MSNSLRKTERADQPATDVSNHFLAAGRARRQTQFVCSALKTLASFLMLLIALPAFTQSADVVTLAGHVPPQLLEGTAKLVGPYNPSQKLRLVLGIQPPHLAEEEQFLVDLQTKGSAEFRHFLTADEWNARFAPAMEDEQEVVDWAESQGLTVTQRYANRLIVDVEAQAGTIEKAFGVSLNQYQIDSRVEFANDRDPQIPASLSGILSGVLGLNSIQRLHPSMIGSTTVPGPDYSPGPVYAEGETLQADGDGSYSASMQTSLKSNITDGFYDPTNIYSSEAYDYNALQNLHHCCNPNNNPGTSPPDTSIAIAAYGVFNPSDLAGFHKQYPYLAYHYTIFNIDGTVPCCSDEATLDVEWSTATSNSFGAEADTSHIFFYVAANNLVSTTVDMYNDMISENHARVLSTSWGGAEVYGWPIVAINTVHPIFNEMTGEGWSLVAAAGDAGSTDDCVHVSVDYPGSDPNFVAAGGTTLLLNSSGDYVSEVAWQGNTTPGSCASNHGGGGGGTSVVFSQPGYQKGIGGTHRHVPDLALNANAGQNYYYAGELRGVGGTSIVAPELAGFFAQENAYLLAVGDIVGPHCGGGDDIPCSPMGNPNYMIYTEGLNSNYADHYPFYDITKDCNSNNITLEFGLTFYCAAKGYDLVTGWGSANMLQLAWTINTYLAWDGGAPKATFTGPKTNAWYHGSELVSWSLVDTTATSSPKNGVAGFTALWDKDPGDVFKEPTPGAGNSYYSGPHSASNKGSMNLDGAGQGCHTVNLRAWDNAGTASGDLKYGPICFDNVPPTTSISVSTESSGAVEVTLTASDPGSSTGKGSGISHIYYSVDNSACATGAVSKCTVYSSAFTISAGGTHTVRYFSEDKAGNFGTEKSDTVTVK